MAKSCAHAVLTASAYALGLPFTTNGSSTILRPPTPFLFALVAHACTPATESGLSAITASRISVSLMPGSVCGAVVVGGTVGGAVGGAVGTTVGGTVGASVTGGITMTVGGVVGGFVGAVVGATVVGGLVTGATVVAGSVGRVPLVAISSVLSPPVSARVRTMPRASAAATAPMVIRIWLRFTPAPGARGDAEGGARSLADQRAASRAAAWCTKPSARRAMLSGSPPPMPPVAPFRRRA